MTWSNFAEGLRAELPYLSAGTLIVIKEPGEEGRRRYVQFVQEDDRLISEVVANCFLEGDACAPVEGEQIIRSAGWRRPETSDLENWRTSLSWPASSGQYRALVEMVVTALRDGYGIESPESWRYEAWNNRRGNHPVELNRLGLEPA